MHVLEIANGDMQLAPVGETYSQVKSEPAC